ncbi:putative reverse transcriptase domain-containing protein [Tanacetum coccineum]
MPPYEMLYGRKFRTPICWGEIGQRELANSNVIQQTNEKINQIKERLKMAKDRQKSYKDKRRRPIEFQVGDRVMLKVSPLKGVIHFRKHGKLGPRYIGLFRITDRVRKLRKCLVDEAEYVPLADIVVDEKLGYVEEPVEILDTMVKKLRRKDILIFKVRWKHRKGLDYTWEPEQELIKYYPAFHQETTMVASLSSSIHDEVQGTGKEGSVTLHYPMLTKTNYFVWAIKMRMNLQAQGVWDATQREGVVERQDRMALAAIY